MPDMPIILLAAGASKRMGTPKQLLPWGEQTLIAYQIAKLQDLDQAIIVVLGAHAAELAQEISDPKVQVVYNKNWQDGMATSIAAGINFILEDRPKAKGALICLVDQPLVPARHYKAMIEQFQKNEQRLLVSRSMSGYQGVPVLFPASCFSELIELQGDAGAKAVISEHSSQTDFIVGEDDFEDMDSYEKYQELLRKRR